MFNERSGQFFSADVDLFEFIRYKRRAAVPLFRSNALRKSTFSARILLYIRLYDISGEPPPPCFAAMLYIKALFLRGR